MKRAQIEKIVKDLDKKMVFIVGPRQVGKTWVAKSIANNTANAVYLNYDSFEDRKIILNEAWLSSTKLLVLDEIHKMNGWKNYLKGVFDTKPSHLSILVTGSARLDTFRQSGDSLAGRFFVHHLLPFTPQELSAIDERTDLEKLEMRGGFPEPFLAEEDADAERWRLLYADSLIRTDVFDFEKIQDMRAIQLVFELLRRKVGSPVSINSIAEDVQISPNTVKKYIAVLEALYIVFRITPFSKNIARSLIENAKIYFYDTGLVQSDEGARLENVCAVALLRHVLSLRDYEGVPAELHYLRTKEKKEVDFCLTRDDIVEKIIEVKKSQAALSPSLKYFHSKYDLPAVQVVGNLKREYQTGDIEIRDAASFLSELKI